MTDSEIEDERIERTFDFTRWSSLTTPLVETIAEYRETDPLELDFVLYEELDTDAFDSLFESASGTPLRAEFSISDVTVTVKRADGDTVFITVTEAETQYEIPEV